MDREECGLPRRALLAALGGTLLATGRSAAAAPVRGPGQIQLTLRADPLSVKFANPGGEPVRILKPLDGSEWGWIMPHYRLLVLDANDREMPLSPRCKLFGFPYSGTAWPRDYLVTIAPGGDYVQAIDHNHVLREAGPYRIRLEYLFMPKSDRTPGGPYPEKLWVGSAVSNMIEVRLSPTT